MYMMMESESYQNLTSESELNSMVAPRSECRLINSDQIEIKLASVMAEGRALNPVRYRKPGSVQKKLIGA
jgi:hypothetical protein